MESSADQDFLFEVWLSTGGTELIESGGGEAARCSSKGLRTCMCGLGVSAGCHQTAGGVCIQLRARLTQEPGEGRQRFPEVRRGRCGLY